MRESWELCLTKIGHRTVKSFARGPPPRLRSGWSRWHPGGLASARRCSLDLFLRQHRIEVEKVRRR